LRQNIRNVNYVPRPGTLSNRSSRNVHSLTTVFKVKVTRSRMWVMAKVTRSPVQGENRTSGRQGTRRGVESIPQERHEGQGREVTDRGQGQGQDDEFKARSSRNMPRCRVHSSVTTPVISRRRFMAPRASRALGVSGRRTPSTTGRLSVPDGVIRGNYKDHTSRRDTHRHNTYCSVGVSPPFRNTIQYSVKHY